MNQQQEKCAHLWTYMGVRFREGQYPREGSDARTRYYGQAYLCQKCALTKVDPLPSFETSTHADIAFGATPATKEEFPIEDERESNDGT